MAYHEHFKYRDISCYMNKEEADNHSEEMDVVIDGIRDGLKGTNFSNLDFCDVNANGIQVRLFHKDVSGYCFGNQQTINHNWNNIDGVIERSIEDFKCNDTPDNVSRFKNFIADGEKYGWD